jgi:hypothetical protein
MTTHQLTLYGEVIIACYEFDTKHKNTLCEYNVEMFSVMVHNVSPRF